MSDLANFKNHEHVLDLTEIRHKKGAFKWFPIESELCVQGNVSCSKSNINRMK